MNKLMRFYNKQGWIIRTIFILLIALWINFYILPDLKTPSDNIQKVTENNVTYLNLEEGYFNLNQGDLSSGNINTILWKLIYLGGGKDKICFEKTNLSNNNTFSASYNNGSFFNVTKRSLNNSDFIRNFQTSY